MWVTVLIQEQFKTIALVNLVYRPTKKKRKTIHPVLRNRGCLLSSVLKYDFMNKKIFPTAF